MVYPIARVTRRYIAGPPSPPACLTIRGRVSRPVLERSLALGDVTLISSTAVSVSSRPRTCSSTWRTSGVRTSRRARRPASTSIRPNGPRHDDRRPQLRSRSSVAGAPHIDDPFFHDRIHDQVPRSSRWLLVRSRTGSPKPGPDGTTHTGQRASGPDRPDGGGRRCLDVTATAGRTLRTRPAGECSRRGPEPGRRSAAPFRAGPP